MNARRTVVVGVDGSAAALRAVRWAVPEARRRRAVLLLVTALAWTEDRLVGLPGLGHARYGQYLRTAAENELVAAEAAALEADPDLPVERELALSFAAGLLLERSQTAELLVVGDHGRGRIGSAVAGSVAISVAARSTCPIVVVRGAEPAPDRALPVVVGIDGTRLSEAAIPSPSPRPPPGACRSSGSTPGSTRSTTPRSPSWSTGRPRPFRPRSSWPSASPDGGEVPATCPCSAWSPADAPRWRCSTRRRGPARRRRLPWARRDRGPAARFRQQRTGPRGGCPVAIVRTK